MLEVVFWIGKEFVRISKHENFNLPAEKVDAGEVQQICMLQPKHPPQSHIAWYQTTAQVLYTIAQRPIHKGMDLLH